MDPLRGARVRPRASFSTGHRLQLARSRSTRTGKWAPYALALLPWTTDTQQAGCRTILAAFLNASFFFSVSSSCLLPFCLYTLSPLIPRSLFKSTLQSAAGGLISLLGCVGLFLPLRAVLVNPRGNHTLFFPLIPHASGLISRLGEDAGREVGQPDCMCRQAILNWCFVE